MPYFKPVKTVIVGYGMIASKGYQPRCQAYPHKIELVGYSEIPPYEIHGTKGVFSIQAHDDGRGIRKRTLAGDWEIEASPEGAYEGLD